MKTSIAVLSVFIMIMAFTQSTYAQESNFSLKDRHNFGISAGLINKTSVLVSSTDVNTKIGLSGGIYYDYGLNEEFALDFYAGYLQGEVKSYNYISINEPSFRQTSAFVMPLLAGIKYYPIKLAFNANVRPYASLNAGIVTGYSTYHSFSILYLNVVEHKSQSVFACKLVTGIDTAPSQWFRVGVHAGYLFAGNFDEAIGNLRNYSGIEFNVTAGFSL